MNWLKDRFRYAFEGLHTCFRDKSILLQMIFGLIVIVCGFLFRLTRFEWIMVSACIAFVISLEIVNSCIEKTVNYISLERNPNAKEIKDLASAAVLMASIGAAVIGLLIFVPKIL